MSAIAGIYCRNQQEVISDELSKMVEILSHRGPDGFDIWHESSIGLGHRMLWSTPESLLEVLPFTHNHITITADARIDNRSELIPQLGLGARPSEEITDSEVILAAYEKWGEHCPEELLGDFAFAIWDSPNQRLFCARDHFGVKPLYYYASEALFAFATEIKALFCVEGIPRQLNRLRMGDYLLSMFHDTAMTSYQKILRLPPAHRMTISADGVELSSYWQLDASRSLPPASNEEYAAELREIFTEAVNCRLRSAYPIGSTLSGGLDSSSITCVARDILRQKERAPLHTFSAIFDSMPECDERKYTKPIFEQGGLIPHLVQGNCQTAFENIEKMFWHQDEAFYAPNWFMSWPLYAEINKQGVRVILDGFDGDNAVSEGYGLLSELADAGRWLELTRQVWRLSRVSTLPFWYALWAHFHHYRIRPVINRYRILRRCRKILNKIFSVRKQEENTRWDILLNPQFSEELNIAQRHQEWRKTQGHGGLSERQRQYRNLVMQGTESFALEMTDKTTAAFSIEPRYPFWDKRLIEFCLALPAEQKLHDGWTRVVMRRAMSCIVPDEVRWRQDKTDFSHNLTNSLVNNRSELLQAETSLCFAEGYISKIAFKEIYHQLLSTPSTQSSRQVWLALSLSLWIRYAFGREKQHVATTASTVIKSKIKDKAKKPTLSSIQ